jgi:two-component sensor histidine kinase
MLASVGLLCLRNLNIGELFDRAARMAADGAGATHSSIAEFLPAENKLLIRAGIGWSPGVVGAAKVEADIGSPAGFSLRTGQPLIANHLEDDNPFRTPELLRRHGIRRTVTVIIAGDHKRFGVLEAASTEEGEFTGEDLPFLQGIADLLGLAHERRNVEHDLRSALEWQKILLDELNHRVKNSLQLAATSLLLEAGSTEFDEVRRTLQQASTRIAAIAQVHKNLASTSHGQSVGIAHYLIELRDALRVSGLNCDCDVESLGDLHISAERAVPMGLLINELVTNAAKHGPPGQGSSIHIHAARESDEICVSVRDEGPGLPSNFDLAQSKGVGMRIVRGLASQIGGSLTTNTGPHGTEIVLRAPLR